MNQKIKNFFLSFQRLNKPAIFAGILIVVILTAFAPLKSAQAGMADFFFQGITKFVIGAVEIQMIGIALALMLVQLVSGVFPFIAAEVLKIAMIITQNIPLIPTAGASDMVTVGWQFTRDLANMFFILILAWIGFATILRLETYQVKKLLPKLLIIALLINFIPLITGVILDIANIITGYFIEEGTNAGELFINKLPVMEYVRGGVQSLPNLIPGQGGIYGMAAKSLMGIIFNLVAFFVLLLYAFIFIVRIVAIWILIVLAPLAWLGYIIPQAKKMWDMWWSQFIQWAIIGIPLAFFLYLSGLVLGQGTTCEVDVSFEQ